VDGGKDEQARGRGQRVNRWNVWYAIAILMLSLFSMEAMAWGGDSGTVTRVWVNGWPAKPNVVCFQVVRADGSNQWYGVRADAVEENKQRLFSMLIAAQVSGKPAQIYYHPDAPNPTGPTCEVGDVRYPSRGVQSVSMIP
jgi:hypothetical protein